MLSARHKIRGTSRQLFHQLHIPVCTTYTVQTAKTCKNRLHIGGGQQRTVYFISFHNGDSTVYTLGRYQRDTGLAQILNIPVDRPSGYLKLFCQIRSSHLILLKKDG